MARGWDTARKALHQLRLAGIDIHESVYREWESGARMPTDERIAELAGFYGTTPYTTKEGATPSGGALVRAIEAQTAAIERQTAVMELLLSRLAGLPAPDPDAEDEAHTAIARTSGTLPHRLPDPTPTRR